MPRRKRTVHVKSKGVAERVGDAPPSGYKYGAAPPLVWCEPCDRYYKSKCDKHDP